MHHTNDKIPNTENQTLYILIYQLLSSYFQLNIDNVRQRSDYSVGLLFVIDLFRFSLYIFLSCGRGYISIIIHD